MSVGCPFRPACIITTGASLLLLAGGGMSTAMDRDVLRTVVVWKGATGANAHMVSVGVSNAVMTAIVNFMVSVERLYEV